MVNEFEQAIELAKKSPGGAVLIAHLDVQVGELEKLYQNEHTRDAAFILATDWLEHGSSLRKAAARDWAEKKGVIVGDKPDPEAKQPKPNDLSNGRDAPNSSGLAAGQPDGAATASAGGGKEISAKRAEKGKGGTIARLRALRGKRGDPRAGGGDDTVAAAYEAGQRDATRKHADAAHRIGALAARHAFAMGARVAAKAAQPAEGRGTAALPIPTQATNQPLQAAPIPSGMGDARKADVALSLTKAFHPTGGAARKLPRSLRVARS